jgi:hypothetical protein
LTTRPPSRWRDAPGAERGLEGFTGSLGIKHGAFRQPQNLFFWNSLMQRVPTVHLASTKVLSTKHPKRAAVPWRLSRRARPRRRKLQALRRASCLQMWKSPTANRLGRPLSAAPQSRADQWRSRPLGPRRSYHRGVHVSPTLLDPVIAPSSPWECAAASVTRGQRQPSHSASRTVQAKARQQGSRWHAPQNDDTQHEPSRD